MTLQNSADKFGSLTKILHWSIFILFIVQYYLMYRREYFPKDAPDKLQYMLLHKSLGVCLLILAFCMLIWRQVGRRPLLPLTMSLAEVYAAKITHFLLYACMIIQPLTGIAMSFFGGRKVGVFGWFELPNLVEKNESFAKAFDIIHIWCSYFILGLVGVHIFAALYHHFIKKDSVLKRML